MSKQYNFITIKWNITILLPYLLSGPLSPVSTTPRISLQSWSSPPWRPRPPTCSPPATSTSRTCWTVVVTVARAMSCHLVTICHQTITWEVERCEAVHWETPPICCSCLHVTLEVISEVRGQTCPDKPASVMVAAKYAQGSETFGFK